MTAEPTRRMPRAQRREQILDAAPARSPAPATPPPDWTT